jgi:outer membrane protein assembly factor BamB
MVAMHRLLTMTLALSGVISAADLPESKQWAQFRGPGSTGVADDPALPDKWSQTENVAWKTAIPGVGWSSPIIWGDRIFVTSVLSSADAEPPKKGLYFGGERKAPTDEHRWMVYAVDFKTGNIVWEREASRGVPGQKHLKNSYASETPVTDGERVYVYFGNVGLYCYDFSGKLLWSQPVKAVARRYGWGSAASPVLDGNRLYIVNDNDDHSYLQSLDAKTGKVLWSVDRNEKTNWATPYIWSHDGKKEIVTPGTGRVRSYDLDGKLLWEFGGMSSISIPTPFASHGLLYVTSGYVGDQVRPVYAVKPGAHGDLTLAAGESSNSGIAWYLPQAGPYNPSPLVYGDYYYTLLDRGFLTAHEAATGKEIYGKQRLDPAAGAFTASPWAANGKLFLLSEDGDTFVVQAGAEYKLIGKNSLDEMCMATPAIARGSLVIRTASNLYRIAKER